MSVNQRKVLLLIVVVFGSEEFSSFFHFPCPKKSFKTKKLCLVASERTKFHENISANIEKKILMVCVYLLNFLINLSVLVFVKKEFLDFCYNYLLC